MKTPWAHHAAQQWPFALIALVLWCAMLPLAFTRLGFEPAIASSPFVASLVDVVGIIIYFNIAIQLLGLS